MENINWHGVGVTDKQWQAPNLAVSCGLAVRPDQNNSIRADEYLDDDDVLREKVAHLANLLRQSKKTLVYSGAGLSRAAGIADYASKAANSLSAAADVPKLKSPLDAQPTLSHCVIAQLVKQGLIHGMAQQNHDGMAQKAGVPEHLVNEIHGAWFDPSNPVVQFNQSLRGDLFEWLLRQEAETELCVCCGTSLSGMNADRVVESTGKRFKKKAQGLGSVIINLQRTRLDKVASLRIWAPADKVFALLSKELNVPTTPLMLEKPFFETLVPYDADGAPMKDALMKLDVRVGQQVVSGQAEDNQFRHRVGVVSGMHAQGHAYLDLKAPGKLTRRAAFGSWWLTEARQGLVRVLPVRNAQPQMWTMHDAVAMVEAKCEAIAADKVRWSVEVMPTMLPIASVRFELHPTFVPPLVDLLEAPFKLTRIGWGTFDVQLYITFVDHSTLHATYELDFSAPSKSVPLLLKHRKP